MFVSKHGGQSEIVLRVKQGDNPTFHFLMPDHHLHPYFRFLVEHQELLESDIIGKSLEEENKADGVPDQTVGVGGVGALSLLGSVYGSGEDEDGATDNGLKYKTNKSDKPVDPVNITLSHDSLRAESSVNASQKDATRSKHALPLNEKVPVVKKNRSISAAGITNRVNKEGEAVKKSEASALPSVADAQRTIVEPPSDTKRVIEKIVEFILKNGKAFETVLVEQDSKHGRFRFLLPSNQYHPYYLDVLQKAQESKLSGTGFSSVKHDSSGHGVDKKTALSKESDTLSFQSSGHDIPYDDRKEKFKMVLGKSKKDEQDSMSKASQPQIEVNVDAAAAAAILQAATRGIKNPTLGIFARTSLNKNQGPCSDGGQASSFGSFLSSQPQSSIQKSDQNGEPIVSVPVAKAIAKTAAIAAASEADSSEAGLSREQNLKVERLRRAKMFAAMIKGRAAPLRTEPLQGLSLEPLESLSGSAKEVNILSKEREGSSNPFGVDTNCTNEKSEMKNSADDNQRRSKRRYRSRSEQHNEEEEEEENEELVSGGKGEKELEERDHRHSRKRQKSDHSKRDEEKEGKEKEEQLEDRDHKHSRKKRRSHRSKRYEEEDGEGEGEDGEERNHQNSRKKEGSKRYSSRNDRVSRHHHKHDSVSDDEYRSSKYRYKNHSSSDDERWHPRHKRKHYRRSESKTEVELEEGEIGTKSDESKASEVDCGSREALDISNPHLDGRPPSQPPETTEVSDDLRAKIRAMLLATL